MVIGFDASRVLTKEKAGAENYIFYLINALSKVDKTNKYTLYLKDEPGKIWASMIGENPNFTYKVLPKKIFWTQISVAIELLKHKVDIYYSPIHTFPGLTTFLQKNVVMIHGFEYRIDEDNSLVKLILELEAKFIILASKAIITPSTFTKNKVLDTLKVDERKIKVIPEGVSQNFYKRGEAEIISARAKYNLGDLPYIIFVSTINRRKNIPNLLKAFSEVSKKYPRYNLIISGKEGTGYKYALETASSLYLGERINFIGRVDDKDLPAIYSGALLYVNPSVEEGFGLPVLEAMACETPCAISDIETFKEFAVDSVYYFNPHKPGSISSTIIEAINNPQSSLQMVEKAKSITQVYRWDKTASELLRVFESLVKH